MLWKKIGDGSNLQLFFNGFLHKMERKFLKWCKKLIPGRSTMTNSVRHTHESTSECPVNSQQIDAELHQNACNNKQEEVLIEGQAKIEEHLDLSTDGNSLFCISAYTLDKNIMPIASETNASCRTQDFDEKGAIKLLETSVQDTGGNDVCGAVCVRPITEDEESRTVELLKSEMECLKTLQANLNYPLSEEEILVIKSEAEIELNKVCPLEFYDFCLITCDVDYEEASVFRLDLCNKFNLKGCMLFDPSVASLGGDIFSQYEAMIERSTKVFFYLTENYRKDNVHLRVQNGAVYQQLWEKMRWNREKCVPVFPHGRHKLGLALSGVSGLDPTIPENISRCMQATFTENVRKFCVLKEIDSRQKRLLLYKDLLGRILQEYVGRKLSLREQDSSPHRRLKISDEKTSDLTGSVPKMLLWQETQNEIIKAVTQSINSNNEANSGTVNKNSMSAYEVSISESSDIHVGPRIEVNIHLNKSDSLKSSHSMAPDNVHENK